MSILSWLVVAVIVYFAHNAYQRVRYSRKKAEFIRDRRRAAGIPDDDDRPFAVARADALSRRSQQRRDEQLSTPAKKRTSNRTPSRSRTSIDHEAAALLSGIPGILPGYLKDTFPDDAPYFSSQRRRYDSSQTIPSSPSRSSSPIKHRIVDQKSSQKTHVPQTSQHPPDHLSKTRSSPTKMTVEDNPRAQRNLKRRHQASPTRPENPSSDQIGRKQKKASRVTIPGEFDSDQAVKDEDMSDANHSATDDNSEAMEEDVDADTLQARPISRAESRNQDKPARESTLQSPHTAARATAKKREVDELEGSDTEQSVDSIEDEENAQSHPHSSKRSRTVNKELDPSSSLDFEMALPEEALSDFIPVHDALSSQARTNGVSTQSKRQADTSDDRQPGEEWVDFEGLRWRIHPETHQLQRWSDVLEWRSKYRMPRDSLHPMAKELHQVVVHKWLTKEEWEEAKAKKLLSFQEAERLAEKEKLDKEEAEKMRRKQELLAKIRQTSSPNKRIQSYLVQQQRKQLQRKLSRSELSGDVSVNSFNTTETSDGDAMSLSIDSSSILGGQGATLEKPKSRRISLQSRTTPVRVVENSVGVGGIGQDSNSTSGASSPSDSPNRRRGSPLASPYRAIAYPKSKKATPTNSSPLVKSSFPPPTSTF